MFAQPRLNYKLKLKDFSQTQRQSFRKIQITRPFHQNIMLYQHQSIAMFDFYETILSYTNSDAKDDVIIIISVINFHHIHYIDQKYFIRIPIFSIILNSKF